MHWQHFCSLMNGCLWVNDTTWQQSSSIYFPCFSHSHLSVSVFYVSICKPGFFPTESWWGGSNGRRELCKSEKHVRRIGTACIRTLQTTCQMNLWPQHFMYSAHLQELKWTKDKILNGELTSQQKLWFWNKSVVWERPNFESQASCRSHWNVQTQLSKGGLCIMSRWQESTFTAIPQH